MSAKVLLVEDDNNLREIFEMRLKAEGYQTITAGDGEEALVVAMREKPDLIIADVMMPKLSGFEMLETLFTAPEMANTKAIMMTALGAPEDRQRGEKLGVIKYLVKSQVTLEDFVRVVREVLSPDGTQASIGPPGTSASAKQPTNQERQQSMPEDTTTPTPSADGSSGAPSAPAGDAMSGQQSTAQEQGAVTDQINSFASGSGMPGSDAAAPAGGTDAPAPMGGSSDSGMSGGGSTDGAPAMGGDTPAPASTDMGGMQPPQATPPAEGGEQPPASSAAPTGGNTL